MFTVLSIEKRKYKGILGRILRKLPINSLEKTKVEVEDISFLRLRYVSRNGRVNQKKISKILRKVGGEVVYSGDELMTVKPFVPIELRGRLCSNMALEVLSIMEEVPRGMRIGIYDPHGDFTDLSELLLRFTDNLVVVTKNHTAYREEASRLISETGAVLRISRNVYSFEKCHLIVAPEVIREKFMPDPRAVVLTCAEPKVSLCCRVYYKYSFRLPKALDRLRDEDTDTEAFGGALYSLCRVYSIGSLVPFLCVNRFDSQITLSLRKYFEEQFTT